MHAPGARALAATTAQNCPHGYQNKANCRQCSPHLLCKHNIFKRRCVACTGGCEHGKKKYACMRCNPKLVCVHGVWKYSCPTCNQPKPKNTPDFKKLASVEDANIIRVTTRCKFEDNFMTAVRYCTAPDGADTTPLWAYEVQRELAQSLWRHVAHTE